MRHLLVGERVIQERARPVVRKGRGRESCRQRARINTSQSQSCLALQGKFQDLRPRFTQIGAAAGLQCGLSSGFHARALAPPAGSLASRALLLSVLLQNGSNVLQVIVRSVLPTRCVPSGRSLRLGLLTSACSRLVVIPQAPGLSSKALLATTSSKSAALSLLLNFSSTIDGLRV